MPTNPFYCCRLDSLILEALTSLKEPGGSDKHAIAMYIEVFFLEINYLETYHHALTIAILSILILNVLF